MIIKKTESAKTTTYFHKKDIIAISENIIEKLKQEAKKDTIGRARLCLHLSYNDIIQEMIIAFRKGTYVRPHRHKRGIESFHIIEGSLKVVFFDEAGKIIHEIKMLPFSHCKPFIYRLSSDLWHTVIPLSEIAVIHEVTTGPFSSNSSEFAPWSPEELDTEGIRKFLIRFYPKGYS